MLYTTLNRFLLITVFLCSSTLVWSKPRSSPSPKKNAHFSQTRGSYPGYLAEEGPEPILESLPPVDFNRLMLTPIPKGVPAKIPEKKDTTSAPDHAPAREKGNAWERHENLITHVASTTGGEYYLPHPQVDIDDHEEGPEIFPEDLLFFYENGDKGAHGNKNYYIPFNVSPGDLIPETQAAPSRATYRRQP